MATPVAESLEDMGGLIRPRLARAVGERARSYVGERTTPDDDPTRPVVKS
jgi:hypothetical protein